MYKSNQWKIRFNTKNWNIKFDNLITRKTLNNLKKCFKNQNGCWRLYKKTQVRLVARGLEQNKGIDYQDTFASLVRWPIIRFVITIAIQRRWNIKYLNVKVAFMNGNLKKIVYIELLQELVLLKANKNKVYLLKKVMCDLEQASRE